MRLLLDTHAFLWAVQEPAMLSAKARDAVGDAGSQLFVSAVSGFEIANKWRLGKLPGYETVVETYTEIVERLGAEELPVTARHTVFAGRFQWQHRDPFDRLLAAQAACEGLTLVTVDTVFAELPWVETLW